MLKDDATDAVRRLEKESGAKVKFIHVVRNPFDNIATMTLQHKEIKARGGDHEVKVLRELTINSLNTSAREEEHEVKVLRDGLIILTNQQIYGPYSCRPRNDALKLKKKKKKKLQVKPPAADGWFHCQILNILWRHFMVHTLIDHIMTS